jgi:transposase
MKSNNQITQVQSIQHLWGKGIRDAAEIQCRTGIPRSTIYYNLAKLEKTGSTDHKKHSGRPKKITPEGSKALGQYIRRNPAISSRTLANKLSLKGISISYVTVLRHLADLGYDKKRPLATPMLTETHKQKRIEWAQKHINDNWNRTLFTDETSFWLFRNTVEYWYKGARPVRRIPKDRTRINAWGGFCAKGKTSLFCFRDNMTGPLYVDIVRKHLPEANRMLGRNWRLQQDNDPKHTSHVAKEFLQANVPSVMDWPSNSPDLNPIENMWAIVKRSVEMRQPKNIAELERFMVEEWDNIPQNVIMNLIRSMNERCQLVIDNNGERIPY